MRVKHPPMPPQMPPQQQGKSPATNGSRQAQQLDYLKRFRALQQGGKSGTAKNGGKGAKRYGSDEPMLLTDLDEVLDEAYERLLGQRKRHQGRHDEEEANGGEDEGSPTGDKKFAAFRVNPRRLRG